jgi:hypothetical protein
MLKIQAQVHIIQKCLKPKTSSIVLIRITIPISTRKTRIEFTPGPTDHHTEISILKNHSKTTKFSTDYKDRDPYGMLQIDTNPGPGKYSNIIPRSLTPNCRYYRY